MKTVMKELPDRRAPSMPNEPFSAYCKVCWLGVYCLWADKVPHDGKCIHGCTSPINCPEQIAAAQNSANLRHAMKGLPT